MSASNGRLAGRTCGSFPAARREWSGLRPLARREYSVRMPFDLYRVGHTVTSPRSRCIESRRCLRCPFLQCAQRKDGKGLDDLGKDRMPDPSNVGRADHAAIPIQHKATRGELRRIHRLASREDRSSRGSSARQSSQRPPCITPAIRFVFRMFSGGFPSSRTKSARYPGRTAPGSFLRPKNSAGLRNPLTV